MARDAIGLMGIDIEDDGETIPEASSVATVQKNAPSGSTISLVDVDFAEYRRKHDLRTVKNELNLPSR